MGSAARHLDVAGKAAWQFTLRGMLRFTFLSGVTIAAWKLAPQCVVFIAGVLVALVSSRRLVRELRAGRFRCARQWGTALAGWSAFYIVSVGPAVSLLNWMPLKHEVIEWPYTPLIWLHHHGILAGPLDWYVRFWE